jgi:hypothetical protein
MMIFDGLSWYILLLQALLFGFVETHQRHLRSINRGDTYLRHEDEQRNLWWSGRIGQIVGIALLIWLGTKAHWYSPIVLFIAALLPSGLIFGLLDKKIIGAYQLSKMSYFTWPIAALIFAFEISKL